MPRQIPICNGHGWKRGNGKCVRVSKKLAMGAALLGSATLGAGIIAVPKRNKPIKNSSSDDHPDQSHSSKLPDQPQLSVPSEAGKNSDYNIKDRGDQPKFKGKYIYTFYFSDRSYPAIEKIAKSGEFDSKQMEDIYSATEFFRASKHSDDFVHARHAKIAEENPSEYNIGALSISTNRRYEIFEKKGNHSQLDIFDAFKSIGEHAIDYHLSPRLGVELYNEIDTYKR